MKKIIVGTGLLIVAIINSGCPKPCIEANYLFTVNSQISPDVDSVKIHDTIFLISSFPTELTDQTTGTIIDYSGSSDIGSTLGIVKLISGIYPGVDAVDEFEYVNKIGMIYNDNSIASPNKIQQLKYQEVDGFYNLKIGIIAKQKGLYYFGIGNGLSNGRNHSNKCEKASFNIILANTNQHINYFSSWSSGSTLSDYEKPRAYFFKVY
jgi:hypothetical protein